jgi:hypothetical protein
VKTGGSRCSRAASWWASSRAGTRGDDRVELTFVDGVANGWFKSWWDTGETREKGEIIGGKRNGCWEGWHPNGEKAFKGTYADGTKVLTWLTGSRPV